tara:strand:+ start:27 stop:350 length:324 start_codon:yes stop_codon:yes gene_type:complete
MKMKDLAILETLCHTWNDEQIDRARHLILNEYKKRSEAREIRNKNMILEGDDVSWMMDGKKSYGKVIKVKRKKAIVGEWNKQPPGNTKVTQRWDIPLSMLTLFKKGK